MGRRKRRNSGRGCGRTRAHRPATSGRAFATSTAGSPTSNNITPATTAGSPTKSTRCVELSWNGNREGSVEHNLNSITNAHLVCRLLLEQKKKRHYRSTTTSPHTYKPTTL